MTDAPTRTRPARQAPTDLTFDLDEALVERFAADEPAWLADDRRAALRRYAELPIETNQLYTPYIDLRTASLGDVLAYGAPEGVPLAGRRGPALPKGAAALIELEDDRVAAIELDRAATEAGVTVETAGSLVGRDPDAARRLLADDASLPETDKLAQLGRASWNQGVAIRVPAGVRLDRPILIRWLVGEPGRALLTRTVVEIGDGARVAIVEEQVGTAAANRGDAGQALFTGTTEIVLGAGAELDVASIQDLGPDTVAFQHRTARLGEGATLRWALAQLGSRLVRSRVDNRLEGDRSSVKQVEIVFGTGDQVFDLTSYTRHVGRDTTGDLLSKGALLDAARSYMKGLITIERSAVGTDSFLGEFGMNLAKHTRAVAIPSLEIDQPDCRRAAHSSSVGPIDEGQLFYLETRGIPPDEARKFIVLGFLEPVVARVPLDAARDRLRALLEDKWAAGSAGGVGATAA